MRIIYLHDTSAPVVGDSLAGLELTIGILNDEFVAHVAALVTCQDCGKVLLSRAYGTGDWCDDGPEGTCSALEDES